MDTALYASFLIVSFGLIIVPGPNVLVIVATSANHGYQRGLQTVAGTSAAMLLQLVFAAAATASVIAAFSWGFSLIQGLGVCYLLYLAFGHLKTALSGSEQTTQISAISGFVRGFMVSLSNPKTIVFFSAFLPQFTTVSAKLTYLEQFWILAFSFWSIAVLLDSIYALIAAKLVSTTLRHDGKFVKPVRLTHWFSTVMYATAGVLLAALRRS